VVSGFFSFWSLLLLTLSLPNTANALKLLRVTPEGDDVPPGRQVVLQFDRPVIPVGRMARQAEALPITIEPALACHWRWLNTSALACELDEQTAMAPATRYTLTLRPGLKAQDGTTLASTITHTFLTQRPRILDVWFQTWQAPGLPEIRVVFDQPVQPASIESHLYMQTPEGERIATKVRPAERADDQDWIVQPVTELPQDTHVQLRIEPGVIATRGPQPAIEQRTVVAFDTFPPFRFLGIRCTPNSSRPASWPRRSRSTTANAAIRYGLLP
jgi:alpha-2-macroglobulin